MVVKRVSCDNAKVGLPFGSSSTSVGGGRGATGFCPFRHGEARTPPLRVGPKAKDAHPPPMSKISVRQAITRPFKRFQLYQSTANPCGIRSKREKTWRALWFVSCLWHRWLKELRLRA